MNLFKKTFLFLILSAFVASCAVDNLTRLSQSEYMLKSRGDFTSYLALEYLQFSRNLATVKAKKDAEYFAKKGLEVSVSQEFIPENPLVWGADKNQLEEIIAMQKRLETVLNPYTQANLPIQMAHLSYLYDCWAAKESKPIFRAEELAKCREKFYKLLGEIEYYIDDMKKDKQPKTIITEPEFKRFEILFDFNSDKFNDKANKDLLEAIKYLEELQGNYRLLLIGNADRVGKELYNQNLAFKRVQVVKNYLTKNGISENSIEVKSFGEGFPDIISKDGVQQQRNRTVGIYVLTGAETFAPFPLPMIENFIYKEGVKESRVERGLRN